MTLKTDRLGKFGRSLYAIIDSSFVAGGRYAETAEHMIRGGASILQLRMKALPAREILARAREIRGLCDREGRVFILNDRPDIALIAGAHGVHLGQDDLPLREARKILPAEMIIGISTHSMEEALRALEEGPDYIAVGPLFDTVTKGDPLRGIGTGILEELKGKCGVPLVGIGGITAGNAGSVAAADCTPAVISYLYRNGDIEKNCAEVVAAIGG